MKEINVCPGTLKKGYSSYSPSCLGKMFDGKKVSHILDFNYSDHKDSIVSAINRISISGMQEKLPAVVRSGKISIAQKGEQGHYIIKPVPDYRHLNFRNNLPANEHLTMQIASQVYKINTAENAIAFFADGQPVYIVKRFDYASDGTKIPQIDFASLAGKTESRFGKDFKYVGSYEEAAQLIRQNVAAWQVEIGKFFTLVVFNYLFGNGDAHLKNFSLQSTPDGDYVLTPAYDLINTSIHINDGDFALKDGLMPPEEHSETYRRTGHPCKDDFITFGHRIGVLPQKLASVIEMFSTEQPLIQDLIANSFLNDKVKRMYRKSYQERLLRFRRSSKMD